MVGRSAALPGPLARAGGGWPRPHSWRCLGRRVHPGRGSGSPLLALLVCHHGGNPPPGDLADMNLPMAAVGSPGIVGDLRGVEEAYLNRLGPSEPEVVRVVAPQAAIELGAYRA